MSTIKQCDRCGVQVNQDSIKLENGSTLPVFKEILFSKIYTSRHYDQGRNDLGEICSNCIRELKEWVKKK